MATRFYFPSTGAPAVSPAFGGGWGTTTNADRRAMVTTRISSAMTEVSGAGNAAVDQQLLRQYVSSQALAAQTLSGSIKGQVRVRRGNFGGGDPGSLAVRVAKCDSTGSTVTEILSVQYTSRITTPPRLNGVDTATNRRFEQGSSDFALDLASTSIDAGDYLIVEIGYDDATSNTSRFVRATFGDDSSTDLAEDESTTAADNPWIEFSADISFDSGGGDYSVAWLPRQTVATGRGPRMVASGMTPPGRVA